MKESLGYLTAGLGAFSCAVSVVPFNTETNM